MNLIVYDLEATCWRGRPPKGYNEIIEIGALKINQFGEIISKFSQFVKPVLNPVLSSFCRKLTGISQENIDRAKTFEKVINDFQYWIDDNEEDYLLISWGEQDVKYLVNDCKLHNLDFNWVSKSINAKNHYKAFSGLNRPLGLVNALIYEGMEFEGDQHRAITDAFNLSKIVIKYIDEWNI